MADLVISTLGFFADLAAALVGMVLRVRVTVHVGYFQASREKQAFVNVANLSHSRDIEIGAVWFESTKRVPVLNESRPLAVLLKPGQSWETWIPLDQLSELDANRLYRAARVRLAGGRVVASRRNASVPPAGTPPGGIRYES
jgi:hypothetical protein